jgi:hypothetical protein
MLRKILAVVLSTFALESAAANYTDWWWNPAQSGHGLNVGQQGNTVFLSWFTYDEAGQGMWVVLSGPLAGNAVQGDFYRTTGPKLGEPFNPAAVAAAKVGTGRISFASLHSATFDWTVNAKSGSVALVRQSYGQPDPSGSYVGGVGDPGVPVGCPFGGQPGSANRATFVVTIANNVVTVNWTTEKFNEFVFTAPVKYSGQWMDLQGTYTSTNALGPTGTFTGSLLFVDTSVIFHHTLFPAVSPGCPGVPATLTGVKAG